MPALKRETCEFWCFLTTLQYTYPRYPVSLVLYSKSHQMNTIMVQNTQAVAAAATAVAASSSKSDGIPVSASDISFDHTNQSTGRSSDTSTHEKKFECTQCHKRFTRKQNLISHEMIHKDMRPYICPKCNRAFRRKHDMRRHEKLHMHKKPFACSKCGRSFSRADALLRHEKSRSGCSVQRFKRRHLVSPSSQPDKLRTEVDEISTNSAVTSSHGHSSSHEDGIQDNAQNVRDTAQNSQYNAQTLGTQVASSESAPVVDSAWLKDQTAKVLDNPDEYISAEHKADVIKLIEGQQKLVEYLEHNASKTGQN